MMKQRMGRWVFLVGVASLVLGGRVVEWAVAGPLDPPVGAIKPTYRTLGEVEPRINVNSLAGDTKAVFVINQPGSYYLTETINTTSKGGKDGIAIYASGVTLDLNGYQVSAGDTGILIGANSGSVTIRNGLVTGCSGDGILCTALVGEAIIEGVHVENNHGSGISVKSGVIRGCVAIGNTLRGLEVESNGVASGCTSRNNGGDGFHGGGATVFEECSSVQNGGDGISADYDCTVRGCTASANAGTGIAVVNGALVESNTSSSNGVSQYSVDSQNRVVGNQGAASPNSSAACVLVMGYDNTIEGNSLTVKGSFAGGVGIRVLGEHSIIAGNRVSKDFGTVFVIDPKNTWGKWVDEFQGGEINEPVSGVTNFIH